ncbi:MAG: hypothetical protein HKL95_01170 [Phycisphaerae bacterium]|nr:hypothetical protein [Phycisphaerae bacterium]
MRALMKRLSRASVFGLLAMLGFLGATGQVRAKAVPVRLIKTAHGWQLLRGGKPFFIKGAGGDESMRVLKACGGNSLRTWGADGLAAKLGQANKLGLTVTVGMWLGHASDGFNYNDATQVHAQYEQCKKYVLEYRNDPALLLWGVGNEMENGYDHKILWQAVEQIAAMIHRLDPNHPVMTVVAEIGGHKVQKINKYCPDVDIIGINSYGGGPTLYKRYLKAGGVKPYVITEFGPPGTWEIPADSLGLPSEKLSTAKAKFYKKTYVRSVLAARGMCLGSYAFAWGWKVEATPTWYGLFLPDGRRLGAVDVLQKLWSGHSPRYLCPNLTSLKLLGSDRLAPNEKVRAVAQANQPGGGAITYHWILRRDVSKMGWTGGRSMPLPWAFPKAIRVANSPKVTVRMPSNGGPYRLFCYVYNQHHGAAVGNIPLWVNAPIRPEPAPPAHLPLIIYSAAHPNSAYVPAGWMGNYAAISYDPHCRVQPHRGRECLKISYNRDSGWGGIAWQNPANNWGKLAGGFNLTGAKVLSFWARAAKPGVRVNFGYGLVGSDMPYHDSSKASVKISLTTHWKAYHIKLNGRNMKRIVTGFFWTAGANGAPFTFYLSDIKYCK